MDGFWSLRCLNDHIDLPDKIESFLSGSTTPMVVKNGTKKNFSPKNTKNDKNSYKEPLNHFFLENRPPKSGHSDSRSNFEILKSQKWNPKKDTLKFPKIQNRYKEHSNKNIIENRPSQKRYKEHSNPKFIENIHLQRWVFWF